MRKYTFQKREGVKSICGIEQGSPVKINYIQLENTTAQDTRHYHPEGHEYYIYLKGKATLEIEGKIIEASSGDVIQIEAGERHVVSQILEAVECLVIRTNHSLGDRIGVD